MAGQQPGQGGFGQAFGQPFGQSFGQPPSNPAAFTFGAAVPQAAPPAGFGFGQPQPSAPQPSTFTFGQQNASTSQPIGFGAQQAAPVFGSPAPSTFNFGAPATAPASSAVPPQAPRSFDFGSARRKQTQNPAAHRGPSNPMEMAGTGEAAHDEQGEEEFDYEAARQAALASMPSFQGSGGAGGNNAVGSGAVPGGKKAPTPSKNILSRPPPPPPRRVAPQSQSQSQNNQGEDPAEVARREQRANRFAPVASTVSAAPMESVPLSAPGPLAGRLSRPPPSTSTFNAVQPMNNQPFSVLPITKGEEGGHGTIGGGGGGMDDEDGFGGAGRGPIIGTCEDMCPASERERRQNMSDIQIFERVDPNNPNMTSAELAVRRFARTVDDPHPSEFRTRGALTRTMDHLRRLLDRTDARFGLIHKFLWDRYRSVRQDLYIQGITDAFAINIFEEIVRFHVLCEHELCGEDQSGKFLYVVVIYIF